MKTSEIHSKIVHWLRYEADTDALLDIHNYIWPHEDDQIHKDEVEIDD